jgi:hypothetical protein
MSVPPEEITVTRDGRTLPVVELLTGRGFITGKSGSGKSMTASVIAEELLSAGLAFLIVDTDGEYYGLKERYEVLHVGADDTCDAQVGPEHAPTIARLALEAEIPVVLDVSGYLDREEAADLAERVVRELFVREKDHRKPFLLFVEEVHEYLPETGGLDDFGERLLQIAKRGRKRGLGICGISQRPAAVDKDFITQCNWIVWHRLTWNNDTDVVARIIDKQAAEDVEELDNGEAILMTDWDEQVQRVQFKMRETVDVGQTPDFSAQEVPDLKPVDAAIIDVLDAVRGTETDPADIDHPPFEELGSGDRVAAAVDGDADASGGEATATEPVTADAAETDDSASTDDGDAAETDAAETDGGGTDPSVATGSTGGTTHGTRSRRRQTPRSESLLLEVGDMMVYLFVVLARRLDRVTTALAAWLTRSGRRLVDGTWGRTAGGPDDSASDWQVYLLLAVLAALFAFLLWLA